jgi:hypothetical protein
MVKKIRMYVLYVALLSGMLFSAVTLGSNTAYAACDCQRIANDAFEYCSTQGGLAVFYCTESEVHFRCAFGNFHGGPCQ